MVFSEENKNEDRHRYALIPVPSNQQRLIYEESLARVLQQRNRRTRLDVEVKSRQSSTIRIRCAPLELHVCEGLQCNQCGFYMQY